MRTLPLLVLLACQPVALDEGVEPRDLAERLELGALMGHLEELQAIADAHGGNRAVGTSGYAASADYAVSVLEGAGYAVQRLPFEVSTWQQYDVTVVEVPGGQGFESGTDIAAMTYSPGGDVTASLAAIDLVLPPTPDPSSTSGCEAADFAGFTAGDIALIQRGGCFFQDKVANAEAAGASAVLIFNEGQSDRRDLEGWQLDPDVVVAIPVASASFATGDALAQALGTDPVSLRIAVDAARIELTSESLVAETGGDPDHVVVVGGHMDSVPEGPGINDNGTGVALILEMAVQMAAMEDPEHTVRFALWGAEEVGLVGSSDYVYSLEDAELERIVAKLNFDMIGSPNGARFIYDGDGDAHGQPGPEGSGTIEALFESWFDDRDLPSLPTVFDGRSDYFGFIDLGIPAGGLFSGAEGLKDEDEAATFGGQAGEARDACYHRACDSLANIDAELFFELSQASAYVTDRLASGEIALTPPANARGRQDRIPSAEVGGCGHDAAPRR